MLVELQPNGSLLVRAQAWCADHSQWLIPCEIEVTFRSDEPDRCIVRLGDAALDTLSAHRSRSFSDRPTAWLHHLEFATDRPEPASEERWLSQLHAWLAAHPEPPSLVGQDWGYLTPTQAESLIRYRFAAGQHVVLEPTWLEGRDVLRLHDGER